MTTLDPLSIQIREAEFVVSFSFIFFQKHEGEDSILNKYSLENSLFH